MNLQHEQNKSGKELWIVEGLKSLVLVENNAMPLPVCFPVFSFFLQDMKLER